VAHVVAQAMLQRRGMVIGRLFKWLPNSTEGLGPNRVLGEAWLKVRLSTPPASAPLSPHPAAWGCQRGGPNIASSPVWTPMAAAEELMFMSVRGVQVTKIDGADAYVAVAEVMLALGHGSPTPEYMYASNAMSLAIQLAHVEASMAASAVAAQLLRFPGSMADMAADADRFERGARVCTLFAERSKVVGTWLAGDDWLPTAEELERCSEQVGKPPYPSPTLGANPNIGRPNPNWR